MTIPLHPTTLSPVNIPATPTPVPAAAEPIKATPGTFDHIIQTQGELKRQIAEKNETIQQNKSALEKNSWELKRNESLIVSANTPDEQVDSLLMKNAQLKKRQEELKERLVSDEKFLKDVTEILEKLNHEQSKVFLELIRREKILLSDINQQKVQVEAEIATIQAKLSRCVHGDNFTELFKLRDQMKSYIEFLRKLEPIIEEHSATLSSYQEIKRQFEPIEKLKRILDFDSQFPNGVHVERILALKELDSENIVKWNLKVIPPIEGRCRYVLWAPSIELHAMGWKLPVYISAIPDSESTQDADDLLFDVSELYSQHKDFKIVGWDPSL